MANGLYAIPYHLNLRGKKVRARADQKLVRLFHEGKLIRSHPRVGQKSFAASDFPPGTHGRCGLARLVLGSVAEKVTREAEGTVFTVRSRFKPSCVARSCAWCPSRKGSAAQQVLAEAEG